MKFRTRGQFNIKRVARSLADRITGTTFDRMLVDAVRTRRHEFAFGWNRGLGDIALGLVPLFARIRARIPGARIVIFTRADLEEAFLMAGVDRLHVIGGLARGEPIDPRIVATQIGVDLDSKAVTFADPDPTRWLEGRRQEFPPVLHWDPAWNARADRLVPRFEGEIVIGAHVNSETGPYYGYVKDWPAGAWQELVARFPRARNVRWLLFGNAATPAFACANVVDLRGRTGFLDLMATIRTRCRILIGPDSGVLTTAYYLAGEFPLDIISLWSDPRQGILKQDCRSPNPQLRHVPLVGRDENVSNLSEDTVARALADAVDRARAPAAMVHAPSA